jgi:hypothetical protein
LLPRAAGHEGLLLRSEGVTRSLLNGEIERLFALGFALEQLHENFAELARCVQEFARGVGTKGTS